MPLNPTPNLPPGAAPSALEEARPAIRALVRARETARESTRAQAAGFKDQLAGIAAKMQARRDQGLRAPNDPFLLALDAADRLGAGALAAKASREGAKARREEPQQPQQPPRIPKAVAPGGKVAKYQGSAGMDRMVEHEERERE